MCTKIKDGLFIGDFESSQDIDADFNRGAIWCHDKKICELNKERTTMVGIAAGFLELGYTQSVVDFQAVVNAGA